MWGIIPAAGAGSRIQPLAFSKELLPVGSRFEGGTEKPRAVSEYLIDRMLVGGVTKICFVISPGKSDILGYYGADIKGAHVCYTVQPRALGLCDAIFRALPMVSPDEDVAIGLPDTIWFPEDGFRSIGKGDFTFLLFQVDRPESFDAVVTNKNGRVLEVQVKRTDASTGWVWGAFRMRCRVLKELYGLWLSRGKKDEYIGTLVNEYIRGGGAVTGSRAGTAYVDVGTVHGYREAIRLLATMPGHIREKDKW
ncbi:MAG: nucleotidyltransferase family protein [Deltaproteobacteria bacterium]|nr:nucleotidyltransferase family protein [Deltaproteobacteria bacterium]